MMQEVYSKFAGQIYKFVLFKVGNREDAEDITSQVFIKATNSLDLAASDGTKLAWLYQVARTTITDHWRLFYKGPVSSLNRLEAESALALAAEPLRADDPHGSAPDPATEKVGTILSRLPENYRRVLQLRFLQGCSLRETAQAMGVTEANAKVLQHRALRKAEAVA